MKSTIDKILELPNLPKQIKPVLQKFVIDFKSQNSDNWVKYVSKKNESELILLIKGEHYINNGLNLRFRCQARELGLSDNEIITIYNYIIFPFNFYCNYLVFSKMFEVGFFEKTIRNINPIFIDYGCRTLASSCAFSLAIKKINFQLISKDITFPKIDQEGWYSNEIGTYQLDDYINKNRCFYIGKELHNGFPFSVIKDDLIDEESRSSIFANWVNSENIINGEIFNQWVPHQDIYPMADTFEFENIISNVNNYISSETKYRGDYKLKDSTSEKDDEYTFNELCNNLIGNNVSSEYSIIISLSFSLNEIVLVKDGWFKTNEDNTTKEFQKYSEFQDFINWLNQLTTIYFNYDIVIVITDFLTDEILQKLELVKQKTLFKEVITGNIEQSITKSKTIYSTLLKEKNTQKDFSEIIWGISSESNGLNENITFAVPFNRFENNHFEGVYLDNHTIKSTINTDGSFDTERTEIGEMLYQLKYCLDISKIEPISDLIIKAILNTFEKIDIIISIPPSNLNRPFQPVLELAQRISELSGIPTNLNYLKKKPTPALKSIDDLQERKEILENAFSVVDKRFKGKTVLLFDDLYRSGETLNAAVKVLKEQGEVDKIYVLTITKTRVKR